MNFFLLISQNEFFHEIKCNGITSFMEFMMCFDRIDVSYFSSSFNTSNMNYVSVLQVLVIKNKSSHEDEVKNRHIQRTVMS